MTIVDEIKAVASVSEVAARYTEVKRSGRLNVCRCLCGENSDRHPSFTLYDYDNHFHCYACGRHGSVIDLVMLSEGLAFRAAVERLQREYLLNVPGEPAPRRVTRPIVPHDAGQIRPDVLTVLHAATQYYHSALLRTPDALEYTNQRGLSDDTLSRLRVGYADGDLGRALFAQKHDLGLLAHIGLLKPTGEVMRGRLVFPVLDGDNTIFMIGRALERGQEPKYLGLPDGLTHKQPMQFGKAKRGAIVVEGPVDYAALLQWGFDSEFELLALLGTAHTKAIPRLTASCAGRRVFVALDQDTAGHDAALRLISALTECGVRATILTWRDAKDCGELLQQGDRGREILERALTKAGA